MARAGPWHGFGWQALAATTAILVAVAVQAPLVLLAFGEAFHPGMVLFLLLWGPLFGLLPAWVAAAFLRSWRNARRDSPFAIAGLAAVALLGAGAWMWLAPPSGNVFAVDLAPGFAVGATLSLAAAARTGRTAPALLGLAAGFLVVALALPLVGLYADDAGGAAPMAAAVNLAVAALAGAGAFAWAEPRAAPAPPSRGVPRG